ncbi:MAG: GAF domain-containing protein [Desulfobacterales bacterium]
MQKDPIHDARNLSLLKMISTNNIEEQCAYIDDWLKQHYQLKGVGFFLKEPETTRTHFFTESLPMKVVQNLEETLISLNQKKEAENLVLFLAQKDWEFIPFSQFENPAALEPLGVVIPLGIPNGFAGMLTLLADSETIHNFIAETPSRLSFVPLISMLLNNAYSHEIKDKKIRMLNLYQSVSSSLAYINDLQELLTTITGIVTSELFCEESSILFYDEETNEFEFFSAFGETGMGLVSTRFPADRGIAGRAVKEMKTQVVNDCPSDPDFYCAIDDEHGFKTKSIIAAPLIAGEEIVGVLNAVNKIETKFFDKEDDQILSAIADEVAMAVKNTRLFEYVVEGYCKIKQGLNSCKGCKRPLKSWTPCAKQMELL